MAVTATIRAASQVLCHVPDLVLSGSKVRREVERDPELGARIAAGLRSFDDAARYLPNQVFI
jgi:hypothetical protein